jgi:hypothetical protein
MHLAALNLGVVHERKISCAGLLMDNLREDAGSYPIGSAVVDVLERGVQAFVG